ncbi:27814_t:CDS:2, partial [Racocetra persica]
VIKKNGLGGFRTIRRQIEAIEIKIELLKLKQTLELRRNYTLRNMKKLSELNNQNNGITTSAELDA